MVHLSAIGADLNSPSMYARTKAKGETVSLSLLKDDFARVTVLRPSIVFGPEDSFFNRFENMSRYLPFLPLVGGGNTKYQPVHVEDVATAIIKALAIDADMKTTSGIYELGGKTVLTFRQLMQMILDVTERKRLLIPIPFPVASMQGALFELIHSTVPSIPPLLTRDQVELLKSDNVVAPSAKTLYDLGIEPKGCSADTISYIG
ncbi:NAD-dependent epimerase/dehydratase [Gracilaria domingensis]|nr:NAD-dependent epimerase/dehydratase [Gracilaria domingensis]